MFALEVAPSARAVERLRRCPLTNFPNLSQGELAMDTRIIVLAAVVLLVALPMSVFMFRVIIRTVRRMVAWGEYRDYVFEKMDSLELKRATVKWFERHAPALEALGFRVIDTYRLHEDILPNHSIPLIIHHASSLGNWIRLMEKKENIQFKRFASTIEWWDILC